jgi:hypothetical protein
LSGERLILSIAALKCSLGRTYLGDPRIPNEVPCLRVDDVESDSELSVLAGHLLHIDCCGAIRERLEVNQVRVSWSYEYDESYC